MFSHPYVMLKTTQNLLFLIGLVHHKEIIASLVLGNIKTENNEFIRIYIDTDNVKCNVKSRNSYHVIQQRLKVSTSCDDFTLLKFL